MRSWRTWPARCDNTTSEFCAVIELLVELSEYDLTRGRVVYRFKS